MTPAHQLILELRARGVLLWINSIGDLVYDAPEGIVTDSILAGMRQLRDELRAVVERIEERAAIMEYNGGLARVDAERLALVDVLGDHPTPEHLPEVPGWLCPWCRRGDQLADDPGGMRCDRCNRLAWRWIVHSCVRADFIFAEL